MLYAQVTKEVLHTALSTPQVTVQWNHPALCDTVTPKVPKTKKALLHTGSNGGTLVDAQA